MSEEAEKLRRALNEEKSVFAKMLSDVKRARSAWQRVLNEMETIYDGISRIALLQAGTQLVSHEIDKLIDVGHIETLPSSFPLNEIESAWNSVSKLAALVPDDNYPDEDKDLHPAMRALSSGSCRFTMPRFSKAYDE